MGQSSPATARSLACENSTHDMSNMIDWLHRDSDSPSIVLQFLSINQIVQLHSTCHAWRSYMRATTHPITTPKHELLITSTIELDQVSGTSWLRSHVFHLSLECLDDDTQHEFPRIHAVLPLFRHLQRLEIWFTVDNLTEDFFAIVSSISTLQHIRVSLRNRFELSEDGPHRRLREMSFAPLKRLQHLTSLELVDFGFILTKQQTDDLLQCSTLEILRFGKWYTNDPPPDDRDRIDERSRQQWMEDTLGRMDQLPHLQELHLRYVDTDVWRYLTKCQNLTGLRCHSWFELGEEWKLLANFPRLKIFHFETETNSEFPGFRYLPSAQMLAALEQSKSITELSLTAVKLRHADFTELLHALPVLDKLALLECYLENPSSFAASSSITDLQIVYCTDCKGRWIHWPDTLPLMPNVTHLTVFEHWLPDKRNHKGDPNYISYLEWVQQQLATRVPSAKLADIHVTRIPVKDFWKYV